MAGTSRRTRRGDAGAIVPMVAVMMTLLTLVTALVVDIGMQRVLRRDLQALADVVALDLVRALDGRTVASYPTAELDAARDRSVARNATTVIGGGGGGGLRVTYELGDLVDGSFRVARASEVPRAVRVQALGAVDFAFAPGRGPAGRTAVAVGEPQACFSVGSYAARVRTGESAILGPLLQVLGTGAQLGVLDLQGLAGTQVDLVGLLRTDLVTGGFDELLSTDVRLGDLYLALATVLERASGRTAQVVLLERLGRLDLSRLTLSLGELLQIDTATAAATQVGVNLLDLVTAAAFAANGTNVLALPALAVAVPGVSTLTGTLTIGQGASITCGRPRVARARASQVAVALRGNLASVNLGLLSVSGPLEVAVAVAPAEGLLQDLRCTPEQKRLDVLTSGGLLDLRISLRLTLKLLPVLGGGLTLLDVPVVVTTSRSAPPTPIGIAVTADRYDAVVSTGQDSLGIPDLRVDTSGLVAAGLPLGTITGSIVGPLLQQVLNPLVQGLDALLLSPLLDSLGVAVAGADYSAVPKADCGTPALRG